MNTALKVDTSKYSLMFFPNNLLLPLLMEYLKKKCTGKISPKSPELPATQVTDNLLQLFYLLFFP